MISRAYAYIPIDAVTAKTEVVAHLSDLGSSVKAVGLTFLVVLTIIVLLRRFIVRAV